MNNYKDYKKEHEIEIKEEISNIMQTEKDDLQRYKEKTALIFYKKLKNTNSKKYIIQDLVCSKLPDNNYTFSNKELNDIIKYSTKDYNDLDILTKFIGK